MAATPDDAGALAVTLGHPVDLVLPPGGDDEVHVAVSRTGVPTRMRAAWVAADGTVRARLGCPPGVPSAARPITCATCDVAAEGVTDRILLGRVAPGVQRVRVSFLGGGSTAVAVHADGIVAGRLPPDREIAAVDALSRDGEPIGRLMREGIHELALVAGRVEGRLGASHGLAAGFGAGDTVADLAAAELEAGYTAILPRWLPEGFRQTTVRVEPEAVYPFAPPSIAVAWAPGDEGARILLRQCPAPLAVPETADARGRAVDVNGHGGVMRVRGMAFLVWEAGDRAFGLQVRGTGDNEETALGVARSVPAPATGIA